MMPASENSLARLSGVKCVDIQEPSKPTVGPTTWRNPYSGSCKKIQQGCSLHSCFADKVAAFHHLRTRRATPGGRSRKYSATMRRNEPDLYTAAWADFKTMLSKKSKSQKENSKPLLLLRKAHVSCIFQRRKYRQMARLWVGGHKTRMSAHVGKRKNIMVEGGGE